MDKWDPNYLERLCTLPETDDFPGPAHDLQEPLTLHRRGQRFKSSTAHHTEQKGLNLSSTISNDPEEELGQQTAPY
jgi:hypothetical protein